MNTFVSERPGLDVARRAPAAWPSGPVHPGLRLEESDAIRSGAWLSQLSEPLRHAILGRARVRQLAAGTPIAQRGDVPAHWIGVASGAVRLGSGLRDGRNFTLEFVGPSQWFGDIELIDGRPLDLDLVAHVNSTVLVVSKADLQRLTDSFDELRDALLRLNCQRLRHMLRRFEELQALSLAQRLARQVQRLARQFGRPMASGVSIELGVSQGDLAAMVGGSRHRVNRAWRQMDKLGIVQLGHARLLVLDEAALAAVAEGRVLLAGAAAAEEAGR
ncbi:MAG: Crp/Fnr family transcriptional regulator [Burkholderiales bacterium]|nr:Crp/Fnr family transcriptional regulator [Burkholderiales bacterium]